MTAPLFLKAGDHVAIIAPAGKVSKEKIDSATHVLESWGLKVIHGQNLLSNNHPYFSGTDQQRSQDLQSALNDQTIKAIFCARGGFGTTKIVDNIKLEQFIQHPKWVVGFSDITTLHLKIFQAGIESIHAIMPSQFENPEYHESLQSLRDVLFGTKIIIRADYHPMNETGHALGKVIGGNLSLLTANIGTPTDIQTEGCILVVEEIDEYIYKVDRMFNQLDRAGKLKSLAGMIVGHFTGIKNTTPPFPETLEEIILSYTKQYDYPVAYNFPVGHESPNLAWKHGGSAELKCDKESASLTIL